MNAVRENARRLAARIDASTPAHRDRAVDGLRALALLAVPLGHWMLGGFRLDADGLHNASPLATFGALAPATGCSRCWGSSSWSAGTPRSSPTVAGPRRRPPGWAAAWPGSVGRCSG
ncbi:membrane protein [Streptomyces badius]